VTLLVGNSGDIAWQLPQWTGHKHPNNTPPATEASYQQSVIALTGWPSAGGTTANCLVRWYYNGTSIGPVYVERGASNDTVGWGLLITGTIEDDPRLHPRSSMATAPGPQQVPALHVALTYEFHAPPLTDDPTASSRITLYADGTHEIDNEWIQRSGEGVRQAFQPDRRDVARTNIPVSSGASRDRSSSMLAPRHRSNSAAPTAGGRPAPSQAMAGSFWGDRTNGSPAPDPPATSSQHHRRRARAPRLLRHRDHRTLRWLAFR
jgi:hypothetical protein